MLNGLDILIHLFNLLGLAAGIALLVLVFMVLLKANRLLGLKLGNEEADKQQRPPQQ